MAAGAQIHELAAEAGEFVVGGERQAGKIGAEKLGVTRAVGRAVKDSVGVGDELHVQLRAKVRDEDGTQVGPARRFLRLLAHEEVVLGEFAI